MTNIARAFKQHTGEGLQPEERKLFDFLCKSLVKRYVVLLSVDYRFHVAEHPIQRGTNDKQHVQ